MTTPLLPFVRANMGEGQDLLITRLRFEAILFSAHIALGRWAAGICQYFKVRQRSNGQNRSNPEGTTKWLQSRI